MLIHFPNALTEEEEALKQAFARLKKKKNTVQAIKTAALQQKKEVTHSKSATKQTPPSSFDSADKATEQAKKLVQMGAIKVGGVKEKSGFKRSRTQERKKDVEKPAMGFQPFMAYGGEEEPADNPPPSKRVKGLGESFVSAGFKRGSFDRPNRPERSFDRADERSDKPEGTNVNDRPERVERNNDRPERPERNYDRSDRPERNYDRPERPERNYDRSDRPQREYREPREPPKHGNTVYVHAMGITEDLVHKSLSSFGKIININVETERNKAFVTFEKMEAAEQAIAQVNGSMVNNTTLKVSMARHQPSFDALSDQTSTASWATIAASNSQKGNTHKDKRVAVQYDHDDMF